MEREEKKKQRKQKRKESKNKKEETQQKRKKDRKQGLKRPAANARASNLKTIGNKQKTAKHRKPATSNALDMVVLV
jgi:hypothetical protein